MCAKKREKKYNICISAMENGHVYLLHDVIAVRHCGVTYSLLAQKKKEGIHGIKGMDGIDINSHALKVQTDTRSRGILPDDTLARASAPGGQFVERVELSKRVKNVEECVVSNKQRGRKKVSP